MRISVKADYAIRAAAELAAAKARGPVKAETIADAQGIPLKYLLNILGELGRANIVRSRRGSGGGFELARPPHAVTLAEVIRAVDGPLANVHESRPEELHYQGASESLQEVWIAVRASLREVLESVTLDHLVRGSLPARVRALARGDDAWAARPIPQIAKRT
jgi:Rrf2 family protein